MAVQRSRGSGCRAVPDSHSPCPQTAFSSDHKQVLGLLPKMGISLGTAGTPRNTHEVDLSHGSLGEKWMENHPQCPQQGNDLDKVVELIRTWPGLCPAVHSLPEGQGGATWLWTPCFGGPTLALPWLCLFPRAWSPWDQRDASTWIHCPHPLWFMFQVRGTPEFLTRGPQFCFQGLFPWFTLPKVYQNPT